MSWILLIVAGALEVGWVAALPATEHFTRPLPTAGLLAALAGSMYLLARATETIPLGTAYVVWVGIGAVGAVVVGVLAHGDPVTPARLGFLTLLGVAIAGLKLTGHRPARVSVGSMAVSPTSGDGRPDDRRCRWACGSFSV